MKTHVATFLALSLLAVSSKITLADNNSSSPITADTFRHIDLLKIVDPKKDTTDGTWTLKDGKLVTGVDGHKAIAFPYSPPTEYDFRIAFTLSKGVNGITVLCNEGDHPFFCVFGNFKGTNCGIGAINGKGAGNNPTKKTSDHWVTEGERYVVVVKIRKDEIEEYSDGHLVTSWKTDYTDMSAPGRTSGPYTLGVTTTSAIVIDSVEAVEITGQGKFLRDPPSSAIAQNSSSTTVPPSSVTTTPLAPRAPAGSAELPTASDVQSLMDAGKYNDALKDLWKLTSTGARAGDPDRRTLLTMRAECNLQLKQDGAAVVTLAAVEKDADQAGDQNDSAHAAALAFLIKKSANHLYVPKTGSDKSPISILDKSSRKAALSALFADEFAHFTQDQRNANLGTTISPILNIADEFTRLRGLELAASGNTPQTDALSLQLTKWANALIASTITDFNKRMDRIAIDDNIEAAGKRFPRKPDVGLTPADAQALRDIAATCQRIPEAVDYMTHAFGHPLNIAHVATDATDTADRANAFLSTDARLKKH